MDSKLEVSSNVVTVKVASAFTVNMLLLLFSAILRCTSSQKRKCFYGNLSNTLEFFFFFLRSIACCLVNLIRPNLSKNVCRADVSHQDMEEINSLQSVQDLERCQHFFFLSLFKQVTTCTAYMCQTLPSLLQGFMQSIWN